MLRHRVRTALVTLAILAPAVPAHAHIQRTDLLWVAEGWTSYYGPLLLVRAGIDTLTECGHLPSHDLLVPPGISGSPPETGATHQGLHGPQAHGPDQEEPEGPAGDP